VPRRLLTLLVALGLALPLLAGLPAPAAAEIVLQPVAVDEETAELDPEEALAAADDPDVVAERAARFPDQLHAHVDRFWAFQFAQEGIAYDPPTAVVGLDGPTMTTCGPADPMTEAAFYCVLDETIYYSVYFRQVLDRDIGDFAFVTVVAHEWGHHIQQETGIELIAAPDRAGAIPSFELEQQADCLAGAYSQWAEADGWLDPGDIEEALRITAFSGDPEGTPWNAPGAHGTSDQRLTAYLDGYQGGIPACDLDL